MSTTRAANLLAYRSQSQISRREWSELETARSEDPDPRVRSAALTVLAQRGSRPRATTALNASAHDPDPAVRRRVCELVAQRPTGALVPVMCQLLEDRNPHVAEAAAAALGERSRVRAGLEATVAALSATATTHDDALVREAAVAALGSIGDPRGLPAILVGCTDKPAIRRRAVLALAPFSGKDVEDAIDRALHDRDWQTRQAAELLRDGDATNASS